MLRKILFYRLIGHITFSSSLGDVAVLFYKIKKDLDYANKN